jgi:flagellar motor switch protein FliN/FliY
MADPDPDPPRSDMPSLAGRAPGPAGPAAALYQIPVEVTVAVGRARPLIGDLLGLGQGAVLPLDRGVDDPVDLYVGDRLIAHGQLEETADGTGLAVRLTEIADTPAGR